jgi:hypothetical protein
MTALFCESAFIGLTLNATLPRLVRLLCTVLFKYQLIELQKHYTSSGLDVLVAQAHGRMSVVS